MAGFWRKCRFCLRCVRFVVWALALLLIGVLLWLDSVGVPNFVKIRLVTALHDRGVQLEFTRMRFNLWSGLLCDNVRIGETKQTNGAELTAAEVQLRLNCLALLHGRLQVDGLALRQGNLNYPLSGDDSLALTHLQSQLRFEAGDTWSLDQFQADFAGATVKLGGEVAHAPEFEKWKMFSGANTADRGSVQSSLKNFSDTLKQIHFEGKPELNARIGGDARDVHSFAFTVNARVPAVRTPWFSASNLQFTASVVAPTDVPTNNDPAWSFWTNLQPFRLDWKARSAELKVAGLEAETVDCSGVWRAPALTITNVSAGLGGGTVRGNASLDVGTREADFAINSGFDFHAIAPLLSDQARQRLAKVSWTEPPLVRGGGAFILPAWTNSTASWRKDIEPTVRLHGDVSVTNATVVGAGAPYSAEAHFKYAALIWSISEFKLTQARTALELSAEENDATKDFRCVVGGKLAPESVQPFLTDSNAVHGFDHLYFRDPVGLVLDASGNLRDFSTLSATGRVVATDFAIRGQFVDSLMATLDYTNLTADFFHPQLVRAGGKEKFKAEKVTLDIRAQKLFLHGGEGHVSPVAVGEAIGPKTAEVMSPYQFLSLPEARVNGCIPLKQADGNLVPDDADLWVDFVGTAPFRWLRFETPRIGGSIHWLGKYLILTNVTGDCYSGTAQGWAKFDLLTPGDGTDFSFSMEGTNVDFNAMGRALWSPTNQVRGWLSGRVNVTSANSSDWRTWNGYGRMQLKNGLLWNAPIFGLMTPLLNGLTPGLDVGSSRATEGTGRFTMTNGVIFTDSLVVSSLTMRLQYVGTVDLQENVSARAKAQLLRNTPVLGSVFSTVLWPVSAALECSVTGTLEKPKITPIYIPFWNVLTAPLHPIRIMRDVISTQNTNSVKRQ